MLFEISYSKLKRIIGQSHFSNAGDANEQFAWPLFNERFPHCETFWREFVIPTSRRIEIGEGESGGNDRRIGVAEDLWTTVAFRHYSLFMQLFYAVWHLRSFAPPSFVNFYTHLGSACDLAEDFLFGIYRLTLECRGEQPSILRPSSKEEFLQYVASWYDTNYSRAYRNYHEKGKPVSIHVPARQDVLRAYFESHDMAAAWIEYVKCARLIREYRNVVVHDHLIGSVEILGLGPLIPKKEKIQQYRSFYAIQQGWGKAEMRKRDFILVQEQMIIDFAEIQTRLNALWQAPLNDMRALFRERNALLVQKYDLLLT